MMTRNQVIFKCNIFSTMGNSMSSNVLFVFFLCVCFLFCFSFTFLHEYELKFLLKDSMMENTSMVQTLNEINV
jgi:hypothetical protein